MCLNSGLLPFHVRGEGAHVHKGQGDGVGRGQGAAYLPGTEGPFLSFIRNLEIISRLCTAVITWPKANTKFSLD